jgi:hypothetical protein
MAVLGFSLGLGLRMSQDKNSTGGVNDFQSTASAVGVVVVIVALSKAEGAAAANIRFRPTHRDLRRALSGKQG